MKILFLTNIPSPYRVKFFNELGKYCELTVLFEKKGYATRDKSWREYSFETFQGIILRGISIGRYQKICPFVVNYLRKNKYDRIIVGNMATITGIMAIFWMKLRHIPYCIEGDGGFAKSGKGFKENLKKKMISSARICFSTSALHDQYYLMYDARPHSICRYPFTSLYKNEILQKNFNREEKKQKKQEMNVTEQYIILSVGSFIHRKGMDILIKAASKLDKNWGIYIIGGKPTAEYEELKKQYDMCNLYFIDFIKPAQLKKYYEMADLFVLATREDIWGLVVNEAMAHGLPVITTRRCVAGTELVKDFYNGMLVEADDIQDLYRALKPFADFPELLEQCAKGALETIQQYTIEEMTGRHLEILTNGYTEENN